MPQAELRHLQPLQDLSLLPAVPWSSSMTENVSLGVPWQPFMSLGVPRHPFASLGVPWHPFISLGIFSCPLVFLGVPWCPFMSLDVPWHPFMSPGVPWCPLVNLGVPWCPLVSLGVPWHPFMSLGVPLCPSRSACPSLPSWAPRAGTITSLLFFGEGLEEPQPLSRDLQSSLRTFPSPERSQLPVQPRQEPLAQCHSFPTVSILS